MHTPTFPHLSTQNVDKTGLSTLLFEKKWISMPWIAYDHF